jgi:large subunit ribosomal protein L22
MLRRAQRLVRGSDICSLSTSIKSFQQQAFYVSSTSLFPPQSQLLSSSLCSCSPLLSVQQCHFSQMKRPLGQEKQKERTIHEDVVQDAEFVEHEESAQGTTTTKKRRITASQLPKHSIKEMESYPSVTFYQKSLKQGFRKVNQVARMIRGLNAKEALFQLEFCGRKVGVPLAKFLRGCMINCENFHSMNADRLLVKEAYVGRGPYLKRIRYHAKMRHGIMRRKTTHFYIKLVEVPMKPNERRLGRWGWTNETWNRLYSEYERRKAEEEQERSNNDTTIADDKTTTTTTAAATTGKTQVQQ